MNVVEKSRSDPSLEAVDFDRFRLRRFIESLAGRRARNPRRSRSISPASPRCSKATRRRCCSAPPGPERQELVGNVMGSRARLAARLRRRAGRAADGNPAPAAQQAGDLRGLARRGAGAAGRADRRRRRPHQAAGASPARRRRRALYLRLDRLRRSIRKTGWTNVGMRRLMLRGRTRDRHRSGRAERSARDLRGERRARASRCR